MCLLAHSDGRLLSCAARSRSTLLGDLDCRKRQSEQLDQLLHGPRVGRMTEAGAEEEEDDEQAHAQNSGPPLAGWSFSRIMQVGGYFPTLAELSGSGATQAEVQIGSPSRATGAWGQRHQPQPQQQQPQAPAATATVAAPPVAGGLARSDSVASNPPPAEGATPDSSAAGKGGKKKPKSQPLFSSGGARSYK